MNGTPMGVLPSEQDEVGLGGFGYGGDCGGRTGRVLVRRIRNDQCVREQ
jgi:hypothetical protein